MSDEPKEAEAVVRDLEQIRSQVRERALHEPSATVLPAPRPITPARPAAPPVPEPAAAAMPPRPDLTAVNEMWRTEVGGERPGVVRRFFNKLLRPSRDAQIAWNARQVQADNELLAYIDGRFHATHVQYDTVLGIHAKHMQEIDERHLILQEELVAHVHDLVKRIDLVLSLSERETLGLEAGLRDLRQRLEALESAPRPPRE